MAVNNAQTLITVPASGDLSSSQYLFMTINSSGQAAATGDGAAADGVLQNDPAASGREAVIATAGRVKVKLGGTVAAGDDVASDTNGKAVSAATGDVILGKCVEGGAVNNIGSIIFNPRNAAT